MHSIFLSELNALGKGMLWTCNHSSLQHQSFDHNIYFEQWIKVIKIYLTIVYGFTLIKHILMEVIDILMEIAAADIKYQYSKFIVWHV